MGRSLLVLFLLAGSLFSCGDPQSFELIQSSQEEAVFVTKVVDVLTPNKLTKHTQASQKIVVNGQLTDTSRGEFPAKLRLNLAQDFDHTAILKETKKTATSTMWIGEIKNDPKSSVVFTMSEGTLTGNIHFGEHSFEIRPYGNGLHLLDRIDKDILNQMERHDHDFGDTSLDSPFEVPEETAADPSQFINAVQAPIIDILVVYTQDLLDKHTSKRAVANYIKVIIEETNQYYAKSGIRGRLRFVGARLVSDIKPNQSATKLLPYIERNANIQKMRNNLGADLVSLLTSVKGSCGRAGISIPQGLRAFSVVNYHCVSNATFAHELGHNMGATHDRANATIGYYDFSFGYITNSFRTIMTYPRGNIPRIGLFSSPRRKHNSQIAGTDREDNTKTLNRVMPMLAKLRASKVNPPSNPTVAQNLRLTTKTYQKHSNRNVVAVRLAGKQRDVNKVKQVIYKFVHFKEGRVRRLSGKVSTKFRRHIHIKPNTRGKITATIVFKSGKRVTIDRS